MKIVYNLLIGISFFISAVNIWAASDTKYSNDPYDEIFDDQGNVRLAYQKVLEIMDELQLTHQEVAMFQKVMHKEYQQKLNFIHFPRMFTPEEIKTLREGVAQRGRAIRHFLQDYMGEKKFSKEQNSKIPLQVMQRIFKRTGEDLMYAKYLSPEKLAFLYGPDIIRDPSGNFRVIEDNPSFVGGFGEIAVGQEIMMKRIPELIGKINTPGGKDFYKALIRSFKKLIKDDQEKMVYVRYPNNVLKDSEGRKIQKAFQNIRLEEDPNFTGIDTVFLPIDGSMDQRMSLNKEEGLAIRSSETGLLNRVGLVMLGVEPTSSDPGDKSISLKLINKDLQFNIDFAKNALKDLSYPPKERKTFLKSVTDQAGNLYWTNYYQQILNKLQILKSSQNLNESVKYLNTISNNQYKMGLDDNGQIQSKMGFPGLLEAYRQGLVTIVNHPGTDVIGDKQFYLYIEDMIRYYLKEEPRLKNLPTASFVEYSGLMNLKLMNAVFGDNCKNKNNYVIKRVDGRGGKAVWIGEKMSVNDFCSLKSTINQNPSSFIVQRFTPLSQMDGHILDMRLITYVSSNEEITANIPWSRATPVDSGDGKVNLSGNGKEAIVMVDYPATEEFNFESDNILLPYGSFREGIQDVIDDVDILEDSRPYIIKRINKTGLVRDSDYFDTNL